jgi:hypothetical protein
MTLKCRCGGELEAQRRVLPVALQERLERELRGTPPRHRKSRIRKKLYKRWVAEKEQLVLFARRTMLMVGAMGPPSYQCTVCGMREGFYGAMGRNMFVVEPMPPGAQVIYDFGDEKILEATDKTLEAVAEAAKEGLPPGSLSKVYGKPTLLDSEKQAFVEKALVYAEGRRVLGKVSSFQEAFTPKKEPPT